MTTLFRCEMANTNENSTFFRWEVETVAEWTDERGDFNTEAVTDDEHIDMLCEEYGARFQYGVYGRRKVGGEFGGVAEHIKDFDTIAEAMAFVGRLNGKEVG
jgi:hypothetical protein